MMGLHPVTIVFLVVSVLAIASFVLLAFRPEREGLPDPESLLDPEYRSPDVRKLLELKPTK